MEQDNIFNYRDIWNKKPVLRAIYGDIFDRMLAQRTPGPTLEIGGGAGALKARVPDLISSDVQHAAWLDLVADAQRLPFADATLSNILMLDVLHHLEFPVRFFREAQRVLKPGGRIVMVEPAITPVSSLFYRLIHHEPVRMRDDPLQDGAPNPARDPYDSNQAIPTLIATRDAGRFHALFPALCLKQPVWFSFAAYPLSGGFKPFSLIPNALAPPLLKLERAFEGVLGRACGFRVLLTIEKA